MCRILRQLCKNPCSLAVYSQHAIDHFTIVCSVTWPLNGNEAGGDLVLIRPHCFCCVNQVVLMLTSWHLHEKSREVCIKARPSPASLAVTGWVSKHTTVKWPIKGNHSGEYFTCGSSYSQRSTFGFCINF